MYAARDLWALDIPIAHGGEREPAVLHAAAELAREVAGVTSRETLQRAERVHAAATAAAAAVAGAGKSDSGVGEESGAGGLVGSGMNSAGAKAYEAVLEAGAHCDCCTANLFLLPAAKRKADGGDKVNENP